MTLQKGVFFICFLLAVFVVEAQQKNINWEEKETATGALTYNGRATFKIIKATEDSVFFADDMQFLYAAKAGSGSGAKAVVKGNSMLTVETIYTLYAKEFCYRLSEYHGVKGSIIKIEKYTLGGVLLSEKTVAQFPNLMNEKFGATVGASPDQSKFFVTYSFDASRDKKSPMVSNKLIILDADLNLIKEFDKFYKFFSMDEADSNEVFLFNPTLTNSGYLFYPYLKALHDSFPVVAVFNPIAGDRWEITWKQLNEKLVSPENIIEDPNGNPVLVGLTTNADGKGFYYCPIDMANHRLGEVKLSVMNPTNPLHQKVDFSTLKELKLINQTALPHNEQLLVFEEQWINDEVELLFKSDGGILGYYCRYNVLIVRINENGQSVYTAIMPKLQGEYAPYSFEVDTRTAGAFASVSNNKDLFILYLDNPIVSPDEYHYNQNAKRNDMYNANIVVEKYDITTGQRISKEIYKGESKGSAYEILPLSACMVNGTIYLLKIKSTFSGKCVFGTIKPD